MKKRKCEWDEYTRKVSSRSNRWAATDRGWFFGADGAAKGNYCEYVTHAGQEAGAIHAVRYGSGGKWCRTVEDAKLFIQGS